MASDDLKALVAREIASGETIAEVARGHGYSWKGMRKLADTPEMQQLVEAERQRIQTLGDQCRAQLLQLGPEALDHLGEVLRNPRHPKRLDAAKFVVEKILPSRTMVEAEVNVGASVRDAESQRMLDDAMIQMAHHLQALREANAGRDPLARVQRGYEVLLRPALSDGRERLTARSRDGRCPSQRSAWPMFGTTQRRGRPLRAGAAGNSLPAEWKPRSAPQGRPQRERTLPRSQGSF